MKLKTMLAFAPGLLLLAGCPPPGGGAAPEPTRQVRPEDPDFQRRLKALEEPRIVWHTLGKGETFYALSRKYNVPVAAIAAANPQLDMNKLAIGTRVAVPSLGEPSAAPGRGPKPAAIKTADRGRLRHPAAGAGKAVKSGTPAMDFPVLTGSTVVAAGAGKVVVATPDLGGLGPTVIVDHGGGLCTVYARLADYAVEPGQSVARGEPIGRAGGTGLHFRVYEGPAAQPPAKYLR